MTDYSRFIAYIYEYVNGIKQYNAGFTKVEVRNGICKIQLVMKNTGRESKVKIYGLVRTKGWLLGILLGEGQIQRQRLDVRIVTDSQKIGGSDYPFQKITGLFIQGTEGRTYATAWDEEPLFLQKFVTELPEEVKVQAAQIEQDEESKDVSSEISVEKLQETAIQEEETEYEDNKEQEERIEETAQDRGEERKQQMQEDRGEERKQWIQGDGREKIQEEKEMKIRQQIQEIGGETQKDVADEKEEEREIDKEDGSQIISETEEMAGEQVDDLMKEEGQELDADGTKSEADNIEITTVEGEEGRQGQKKEMEQQRQREQIEQQKQSQKEQMEQQRQRQREQIEWHQKTENKEIEQRRQIENSEIEQHRQEQSSEIEQQRQRYSDNAEQQRKSEQTEEIRSPKYRQQGKVENQKEIEQQQQGEGVADEKTDKEKKEQEMPCVEKVKSERWQAILNSYLRVDPFEDNEIVECVQISPGDLITIWKKEWRLGRNSFLLHGYYNYHHLILGRTKDDRWIVGVPGIYERQEHFVASRFGFTGFKPAKQKKEGERPFGYWCRVLC